MNRTADAADAYVESVLDRAASDLGRTVPTGTTVIGADDRQDSPIAVVYPLGDRTLVWCSPDVARRLAALTSSQAGTATEIVTALEQLGGAFHGAGKHRVLRRAPSIASVDGYRLIDLDRNVEADRALLADFIAACPDDDLDEAELAMDDLDPAIVALVDDSGAIASYASARPWEIAESFDDIAVITHPDHRGRGLGAAVVGEFAAARLAAGRRVFYSCDVDNTGSNGVAERVGFELVCSVVAVTVP